MPHTPAPETVNHFSYFQAYKMNCDDCQFDPNLLQLLPREEMLERLVTEPLLPR
jgi:hypothetical protein